MVDVVKKDKQRKVHMIKKNKRKGKEGDRRRGEMGYRWKRKKK